MPPGFPASIIYMKRDPGIPPVQGTRVDMAGVPTKITTSFLGPRDPMENKVDLVRFRKTRPVVEKEPIRQEECRWRGFQGSLAGLHPEVRSSGAHRTHPKRQESRALVVL